MSRIRETFDSLRARGEGAYIPYVCAGDPDIEFTMGLIEALCDNGADVIELGMPFSDPIADGPLIQGAMIRSLANGFRMDDLFGIVTRMRDVGLQQPVVVMGYYNTILNRGVGRFCEDLSVAGGDGIIAVDLPIEESAPLDDACEANAIDPIRIVSPNTPDGRLDSILAKASGYVYLVSVAGTTGPRSSLQDDSLRTLRRVSGRSDVPVALGFGISTPEHARMAFENGASAVVEGSRLITIYDGNERFIALEGLEEHARSMRSALGVFPQGSDPDRLMRIGSPTV